MADPLNGDFRLAADSPAIGYGCQTFVSERVQQEAQAKNGGHPQDDKRLDMIEVSGPVSVDTTWNADTVRVIGDVSVENGVVLTIAPGVLVEFEDYYAISVMGTLLAVGTHDERIRFTTDDPQAFSVDRTHEGCWNGIRFNETPSTNAPSRLSYCIIEYSKATADGRGTYAYGGGAISVRNFAELTIDNCIIRHNVADYGGAIFLYCHANPGITGNLLVDNHALQNASAIYCAYSYPRIANNTIVRNVIHNTSDPYIESCAILSFLSKPVLTNNIVRGNDPDILYMHTQLWGHKDYYTHHNNIEDYEAVGGNIDADPHFMDTDGIDGLPGTADDNFRLQPTSPSVDSGLNTGVPPELITDLDGEARFVDGDYDGYPTVDMGAFETGTHDCDGDGHVGLADFDLFGLGMAGPGIVPEIASGCFDLDRDADLDLADFAGFQIVFTGD